MERRDFIKMGIMTSAAGAISSQFVGSNVAHAAKTTNLPLTLEAALAHCLQTGNLCVAHCMNELALGNKEMGDCNKTVHDMLATCEAMLKLTSYKSDLAKSLAKICAQSCDTCAEACKKHQAHWSHGMHLVCKECYDACLECSKLCKALLQT
ncbi:MAG: Csp1 family four helix bundle copper storage protein [Bdellovibrionales bacterium]